MEMSLKDYLRHHFPLPDVPALPLENLPGALLESLPRRLAHTQGVVRLASSLAEQLQLSDTDREALVVAARFHDIGYAPAIAITELHSVNGAALLAQLDSVTESVVEAVCWHGGAAEEAAAKGVAADLYERYKPSAGWLLDLLNFCDNRTSPDGEMVTLRERALEIEQRYGADHIFARHVFGMLAENLETAAGVLAEVAKRAPSSLPWLAIDVDSTLTIPGHELSAESLSALADYRDAGGRLSLATGKHPDALGAILRRCELPGPHVAANGAILFSGDRTTRLGGLADAAAGVISALLERRVPFVVYTDDGTLAPAGTLTTEHLQTLHGIDEPEPEKLSTAGDAEGAVKVLCFVPEKSRYEESQLREIAKEWPDICCLRTSTAFLEFCPASCSKGTALQRIFHSESWPALHSHAIGDSENDLSMLRIAGAAYAVANAQPGILERADAILEPPHQEGVARHIRRLLSARGG